MNKIHSTAIVGPKVNLGINNVVGPYSVIIGPCNIGDNNWIGPHVTIGTPGEYQGINHPVSWESGSGGVIQIGSNNTIREFVTVHVSPETKTEIANGCYLMTKSHVPHDAKLEDGVKFACAVLLGGFGHVGKHAYLGLGSIVHQRLYIGPGTMVGMGAIVTKHVPPLSKTFGSPAKIVGLNRIRLEDFDLPQEDADILDFYYSQGKIPQLQELSEVGQALFSDFYHYINK